MSFSAKVKQELSEHFGNGRHCELAEIAAIINMYGQGMRFNNNFCLKIQTDSFYVAKKCFTLLQNAFNISVDISIRTSGKKRRNRIYLLFIRDANTAERVLRATGIWLTENKEERIEKKIYPPVVSSICCRRAYIREAFICTGSVNDPRKNYHLEFVLSNEALAHQLKDLVNKFGLDAKVVDRKEHFIVYLKEGEQIVDLLNIMEAHVALLDLENVRIVKEMRNDINRKVNCETANLGKVIGAAVKQLEDITYIEKTSGLDILPIALQELARVRLEHPDKSLKELGMLLADPVGKSGVNHRLKKISNITEFLREDKGETK